KEASNRVCLVVVVVRVEHFPGIFSGRLDNEVVRRMRYLAESDSLAQPIWHVFLGPTHSQQALSLFLRFGLPLTDGEECSPGGLKLAAGPTRRKRVFVHQDAIVLGVELLDRSASRAQELVDGGECELVGRWTHLMPHAGQKCRLLGAVAATVAMEARGR